MTVIDSAFEGAGQKPGVEIWRIEKFAPVRLSTTDYGKFHSGDSYIILRTKQLHSGAFDWQIHYWIGSETSQDEKGCAAIKTVELDDMLGGSPIQHRETQEHESPEFLSYFPGGVRYAPGGVASGFKTYDPNTAPPRLFQVKGKRNVRVREVECNVRAMNKGDCFILDTPQKIFVYVGRYSKRTERLKAVQAANQIRDQDHGGKLKIHVIEPSSPENEVSEYFTALGGGSRSDMNDAKDDDDTFEKQAETTVTLYRVSDDSGSVKVEKIGEKPLKREMLQSKDCFILDARSSGIFVWIGKQCSKDEKIQGMKTAEKFLEQNGYPAWTRIQRVVDCGEPTQFKAFFSVWKESDDSPAIFGKVYTKEKIAASNSYVASKLTKSGISREERAKLMKNMGKALGFCPDNGQGKLEMWRIENFELAPVDPEKHGIFFGGDSYVLKYTYTVGNSTTQDEKAASALHSIKLDDDLHGKAIQVRVIQGNEPAHFLRVFKGKMIIYKGGHASGFKNVREHETYDPTKASEDDVRGVEVEARASSLDSEDVFVLDGPSATYIWIGKGANEDEKKMANQVDAKVSPDRQGIKINEGSEPEDFWQLLGGKGDYRKDTSIDDSPALSPRLFHCSITPPSTKLEIDEVHNFDQEDLNEDDVMILNTGDGEIFIWLGKGCIPEEKKGSMKYADDYIRSQHSEQGGNAVTVSIVVKQSEEPDAFTALFSSWNKNLWNEQKSLAQLQAELNANIA